MRPRGNVFHVGTADYQWNKLIVLLVSAPVLVGLVYLVQQTRQGKAMRATAQDKDAAAMMGINVNRTISFTFLIAGALAGAAGLLYALYVTNVRYDQGFQLGLIAFTSAVFGGIGNLPGAVLGALLIGLIQAFNEGLAWHAPGSDWTQSIVFSILILEAFTDFTTGMVMHVFNMMAIGLNIVVGYAGLLDLGYVAFYAMGAYTVAWFASVQFATHNVHFGAVGVGSGVPGFHISIW